MNRLQPFVWWIHLWVSVLVYVFWLQSCTHTADFKRRYVPTSQGSKSARVSREKFQKQEHSHGILVGRGWQKLPVKVYFSSEYSTLQKQIVKEALSHWEVAVGRKLVVFEQANLGHRGSYHNRDDALRDGKSVFYLTGGLGPKRRVQRYEFSKQGTTLILANGYPSAPPEEFWLVAGDVYLNREFFQLRNLSPKEVRVRLRELRIVVMHEIGHFLGLGHLNEDFDPKSVMLPVYDARSQIETLSRGDVKRIQKIYGCFGNACRVEEVMKILTASG